MDVKQVTDKVLQNLTNSADNYERWDALTPTDADYLMYSPLPVGYNTTAEQRFLMQNLLVGFNGGSLLDIGCGRCDLYAVARELAALNDSYINLHNVTQAIQRKAQQATMWASFAMLASGASALGTILMTYLAR